MTTSSPAPRSAPLPLMTIIILIAAGPALAAVALHTDLIGATLEAIRYTWATLAGAGLDAATWTAHAALYPLRLLGLTS